MMERTYDVHYRASVKTDVHDGVLYLPKCKKIPRPFLRRKRGMCSIVPKLLKINQY